MNGQEVSTLFNRYGVFDYLREFYDILHSTGHNYINRHIPAVSWCHLVKSQFVLRSYLLETIQFSKHTQFSLMLLSFYDILR